MVTSAFAAISARLVHSASATRSGPGRMKGGRSASDDERLPEQRAQHGGDGEGAHHAAARIIARSRPWAARVSGSSAGAHRRRRRDAARR